MCRLFLSYNATSTPLYILDFLEQSHPHIPHTPFISNNNKPEQHLDGFGISWMKNRKWNIYKNQLPYSHDSLLPRKIREIPTQIVIGHIRNRTINSGDISMDNTHPFIYKNQIFEHNGKIFDFPKNMEKLRPYISEKLFHKIRGETDTEWLFYLFLTILQKPKYSKLDRTMLHLAMTELFQILKSNGIEILANFIYSNADYAIITRYASDGKKALPLYYQREPENGFIITSEPVTAHYEIIPNKTTIVVDYKEETAHLQSIRTSVSGIPTSVNL